jgi:hypothetical protein
MNDVFISYAHADNEVPEGAGTKFAWVTARARACLNFCV